MNKKFYSIFVLIIFCTQFSNVSMNSEQPNNAEDVQLLDIPFMESGRENVNEFLENAPEFFTANHGQLENDDVRFYAQGGGLWFTDDGVWFELRENVEGKSPGSEAGGQGTPSLTHSPTHTPTNSHTHTQIYKCVILKQEFIDANHVTPSGRNPQSWHSNFFYGNDSSKWYSEVPNYQEIFYENLYDGIDLRYYTTEKELKYDFIVHPGGNVDQIRIKWDGAKALKIDTSGNLKIQTEIKEFMDGDLFIYQNSDGTQQTINGKFVIYDNLKYGFELLEDYSDQDILVIDPNIKLDYSTYLGGSNIDCWPYIAVDSQNNAYITTMTFSSNFPTSTGCYDNTHSGDMDISVSKLNQAGNKLLYSTFIGGSGEDASYGIEVDSMGNAYITGYTESTNFPTTSGCYDNVKNTGRDCYILKLDSSGSSLLFSTYIGGSSNDEAFDIALDSINNSVITGKTYSSNFPTSSGSHDNSYNGNCDPFVLTLDSLGSSVPHSTFLGGGNLDVGLDIQIDSKDNIYITGQTYSSDFRTSMGCFDDSYNGAGDVFACKLDSKSANLLYSTFIGGSSEDNGMGNAIDAENNMYITGQTYSSDFPTTPGCYNNLYGGEDWNYGDVFVCKLKHTGSDLDYSTFLGSVDGEYGNNIVVDSSQNAYVTGLTSSANFPTTSGCYDNSHNGGYDGFLSVLNSKGNSLQYSTFIGGSNDDEGSDIAINFNCLVFISGHTFSSDFSTTPGSFDQIHNGNRDVFVSNFVFPRINITSLSLIYNYNITDVIYSGLHNYTFRVNLIDTISQNDLEMVQLNLDPDGLDIQLGWDRASGIFSKILDINNYITVGPSGKATYNLHFWTIDFEVTFDWTYPDEELHDVQVYATSAALLPVWFNTTDKYQVENDVEFHGTLVVTGEDERCINDCGLVRGGEQCTWTGLKVVYQDTTDMFPTDNKLKISISDVNGSSWSTASTTGEKFTLQTVAAANTDTDGDLHTINITGIPPECDATNVTFTIRIDSDNVSFSYATPADTVWHINSEVDVGITITDCGGGCVNGSRIMNCFSVDEGATWSNWENLTGLMSTECLLAQDTISLEDGTDNLIKWCAFDTLGNGPAESESSRILVDTEDVFFSDPKPLDINISPTEEVEVGITITDLTSGVDASTIKYSISPDNGISWSPWEKFNNFEDGMDISILLHLNFTNGTNRIKWRASDIAGNGPVESVGYVVRVNTIYLPRVKLQTPEKGSNIYTTSVELTWKLVSPFLFNVNYDIILDTNLPPIEVKIENHNATSVLIEGLQEGETYYWTVVPKMKKYNGTCLSSVWSFTVNTSISLPSVTLEYPENETKIITLRPMLSWSVKFNGPEKITYDIYIDTDYPPKLISEKYTSNKYIPSDLENNETYFWKIVPFAGSFEGFESETWLFTIDLDYRPYFNHELILKPSSVVLEPGKNASVKAFVSNHGELKDNISIEIKYPPEEGVVVNIDRPSFLIIEPDETIEFNITIEVAPNTTARFYNFTIQTKSKKAPEYGLKVEINVILTVKASDKSKELDDDKNGDKGGIPQYYLVIILVIIIIITILVLLFLFTRKKKSKEDDMGIQKEQVLTPDGAYKSEVSKATLAQSQAAKAIPPTQITRPTISQPSVIQPQKIQRAQTMERPPITPTTQELLSPGTPTITPTITTPTSTVQFLHKPQPQPQPRVQLQPEVTKKQPTIQPSIKNAELTSQQKLELLEKRFLNGDISKDIYLELKNKYLKEG